MHADKSAMSVMLAVSGLLDDMKGYLVEQHGDVDVDAVLADTMVLWETLKDKMNQEFAKGTSRHDEPRGNDRGTDPGAETVRV